MIFVYKDCSKNFFDSSTNKHIPQILFTCECDDILVADDLAEKSGKVKFKKGIPVGCVSLLIMTVEQFKTF
jgi:hypothetical protein